jgi:hypothetical protein
VIDQMPRGGLQIYVTLRFFKVRIATVNFRGVLVCPGFGQGFRSWAQSPHRELVGMGIWNGNNPEGVWYLCGPRGRPG